MAVAAPHICDFLCEREITCQSYNFNRKEQICELNNRTKDARPENFRSDPAWFYIRRLNGRGDAYVNISSLSYVDKDNKKDMLSVFYCFVLTVLASLIPEVRAA
ncbi:hypothetical protein pdam_00000496 [Pocillopora damicornis]|uniref:Apple domain-containing protein n=1 Tax=Pocillopora damicornis TaxID=46731 RepID=A0A3M6TYB9_POCDA|nr:hypothetical protein pdam_00000496 [Pocillopora damicornis]